MLKDRLIFVSVVFGIILNIILWLLLGGKFGWSAEKIPLHFNVVYGIDFLGSTRQVYEIPLTGIVLLVINSILAIKFYPRSKLFSYFLSFSALAMQAVLIVAATALIVLNA
ncbi:MAG: hypothetical protein A3C85_01275 [Candidatus Doudnabacteria bacterium RIFCSPHIGHO2_02_FULL_48_21]|uniref:DUF1648 domain-containing protein n=1 Tax=Candidatus Doudnabacteria bacterium RIFCSPLOWO2_02_FULL_48_13 TaxID=1817845 RepID=A0A1F5Q937_9BACT|nr:MAG: hypothetical protein A3K05_04320 [Candidatus Doudnabacteria bacterium RIFCSPHIGHO2_01_48_18]OGE79588.1 MAG: hypothetical protein A2668_03330 [Candidatus Doudnabacteria bacterium RIFCSPHIGHO2_01_FULL_48_180]OGE91115.1 MAG: hypothetical protein A3F44_02215 [Candidatus Doudnabacteria bacterium RIFCSPHIGHO2_12_FULL_47_25]OGE93805.1 MAG: hypothetical protein A3C85_01275 [Candidatus Doudnabacteria bacterium RIFCSPHIGHO2_02_FULL_48_21]OGE97991.1 MAG: hypothetical protein A3A83_00860 [Candidatu